MELTARHVFVAGRVQGVGFRWFVREQARELGIVGWVRNLPDGRVEIWIQGTGEAVTAMLARVRSGPRRAAVEELIALEIEPKTFEQFEVV